MTTDKRGISALLLQHQLGLRRYETAWMLLHKFHRAMVNLEREPLRGKVEVDETWIGGTQARIAGKPATEGAESRAGPGGRGETRPGDRACSDGSDPGFQKHNASGFPETKCDGGFYRIH